MRGSPARKKEVSNTPRLSQCYPKPASSALTNATLGTGQSITLPCHILLGVDRCWRKGTCRCSAEFCCIFQGWLSALRPPEDCLGGSPWWPQNPQRADPPPWMGTSASRLRPTRFLREEEKDQPTPDTISGLRTVTTEVSEAPPLVRMP